MKRIAHGDDWNIYTSEESRTAHPYHAEQRADGGINHPSIDLVLQPERVFDIPEVVAFPSLGEVLQAANARFSLLRSTACDAGILRCNPEKCEGRSFAAGAIVHLAYRLDRHNRDSGKLVKLAHLINENIERPLSHFALRLTVEPYKSWHGIEQGFHGLAVEFVGQGVDSESAWSAGAAAATAVASSIAKVSTSDVLLNLD